MRAFLRYLMSIDHLKQLFEANECSGLVEAYVDSNWGSEQNNGRRSLSGCVIFVDQAPVKAFTRQQVSVALSSAAGKCGKGATSTFKFLKSLRCTPQSRFSRGMSGDSSTDKGNRQCME